MEKPLFWHQGLFLQPQHLQLKDVYDHSRFTPYHRHLKPNLWGTAVLSISTSSLSSGLFEIDQGEFWFPDMTYAVLGKNALMENRNFMDRLKPDKAMNVYIGLKNWLAERPNATEVPNLEASKLVETRFIVLKEQAEVGDLHLGGNPAQVKRMFYALRLFFEDEKEHAASYDLIPVGRVEMKGSEIVLAGDYIPPCISLLSDKKLENLVKTIGDRIIAMSSELGSYKRSRGIHSAELGSRDMLFLLVLVSMNRYTPYFNQVLDRGHTVHPQDAYLEIQRLIGELSSFSVRVSALGMMEAPEPENIQGRKKKIEKNVDLPPYSHNDLWNCFEKARFIVESLIHEITSGPDHVLPLTFFETYYTCPMDDDLFKENFGYYLVMRTDTDLKEVVNAIEVSIKVTSPKALPILVERSLPGAIVEYLPVPPQELPRRKNGIYLKIDKNGEAFSSIRKERQLAMFWYSPPQDLQIELMVLKEK
jgi:type VI secretion system protein ImpJ